MELDRHRRQKIYELFIDRVEEIAEIKFVYLSGHKKELLKTFTRIYIAMDKDQDDDFDLVFVEFNAYIVSSITSWCKWKNKDISNLIGFVTSRNATSVFTIDMRAKYQASAEDMNIAGVRDNEDW